MLIDVTGLSNDEIENILKINNFDITANPPGSIPWQLSKADDNARDPASTVIYTGTIDRTFEVALTGGQKPLKVTILDGTYKTYVMFPAPETKTFSSTFIKLELFHEGTIFGHYTLKCPP